MRKRSKYRPRPRLANPLGYVLESMTPVTHHDSYLIDLKIRNSDAMCSLLHGNATRADMDTLIIMSNMTEALHRMGFGEEYKDVCSRGRSAILGIVSRAKDCGRFTPTDTETQSLNLLMELHDAQMSIAVVRDIEKGLALMKHEIAYGKDTVKLPPIPQALR